MALMSAHINAINNINTALSTDVSAVTLDDLNQVLTIMQSGSLQYQQAMTDNSVVVSAMVHHCKH